MCGRRREKGVALTTRRTDALTNPCQPVLMPTVWIHTYRSLCLSPACVKCQGSPHLAGDFLFFLSSHILIIEITVSRIHIRSLSLRSHCVSHTLLFHTIFSANPHLVRAPLFYFVFPESHPHCVLLTHWNASELERLWSGKNHSM